MRHQLTGKAGLYHVARELSRRGWHVMPTVRNARGADLYAASDDESRVLPVQSKALSKKDPVPLGGSLDTLRSDWWVVTIHANTAAPTCYVLTKDEVKAAAHRGMSETGKVSYWLQPSSYALPQYQEAWDRLGSPYENQPIAAKEIKMTVLDDVREFLQRKAPSAVCDDCIADSLKLSVRQHANHKTRELAGASGFRRRQDVCSMCKNVKKVISYANGDDGRV